MLNDDGLDGIFVLEVVFVVVIQGHGTNDGDDQPSQTDGSKYNGFLAFTAEKADDVINKEVANQYPDGTSEDSRIFIPLNPRNVRREDIAQIEPRPFGCPVIGEQLIRHPVGNQKEGAPTVVAKFLLGEMEQPEGVIAILGGQTAINLAEPLREYGVTIIGTDCNAIEKAENRDEFEKLLIELEIVVFVPFSISAIIP